MPVPNSAIIFFIQSADDSKPYPTQPQFHNKAAPMSAPGDQQAQVVPPEDYKNFDIGLLIG